MLEELFTEYLLMRAKGLDHDEAMLTFDYLHPISLARLRKKIASDISLEQAGSNHKGGSYRKERRHKRG